MDGGGGDLFHLKPEHGHTLYKDTSDYGTVSGGGAAHCNKVFQVVVETRVFGYGG